MNREVVLEIISKPNWIEIMKNRTRKGKGFTTPLRQMIKKMPSTFSKFTITNFEWISTLENIRVCISFTTLLGSTYSLQFTMSVCWSFCSPVLLSVLLSTGPSVCLSICLMVRPPIISQTAKSWNF